MRPCFLRVITGQRDPACSQLVRLLHQEGVYSCWVPTQLQLARRYHENPTRLQAVPPVHCVQSSHFLSSRHAQQEQGEMASKQVNKSLAEKPHGYEFLGPYVYLQNTSISTPQLTPPQPWRLCHLFRSARPGLCLHLPVQRHLRMPCAYLAFPFRLQL